MSEQPGLTPDDLTPDDLKVVADELRKLGYSVTPPAPDPPPMIHRTETEKVTVNGLPVLRVRMYDCAGSEHLVEMPALVALRLATPLVAFVNRAVTDEPT